jgi:hypothetical protein
MTELEKMQRAKMYMDRLANGMDPISEAELPEDSTLNNVRLSRCFFYVSDILRQVIENGGTVKSVKRPKRADFQISAEAIKNFSFSKQPIRISEFVDKINHLIDLDSMKKITTTVITGWLLGKGFLELHEYPDGKKTRLPTKQGEYIGLSTEIRTGQYGEYHAVLYNEDAQRFVIDNLDAMLEAYRNKNA